MIIILCLTGIGWYVSGVFRDFYFNQVREDLSARAKLVRFHVKNLSEPLNSQRVDPICKKLGRLISTRITIILPSGVVIGDSEKDPTLMDNHATRPEIRKALKGYTGASTRFSRTLRTRMMYVAIPLRSGDKITGVIRTSKPLSAIEKTLSEIRTKIIIGSLGAILFSALLCFVVSRRISKPVRTLSEGAERFAHGNLEYRISLPPSASSEFHILAETMNRMAKELELKIYELAQQGNELKTVLTSMSEGVVALDLDKRVILLNGAAARLFNVDCTKAQGKLLEELTRDTGIQSVVDKVISEKKPEYTEVQLRENSKKYLLIHATPLESIREKLVVGVLLVFNDITRLKQAEEIRKDFVANVSHELRTPITAIKGAAETLLDQKTNMNTDDYERFLKIIVRNTSRIGRIVEDLLILSQLEKWPERFAVEFEQINLSTLLLKAKDACSIYAEKKRIDIEVFCGNDLTVLGNPHFLEQALINLIDNAIKYSPSGSKVIVKCEKSEDEVIIRVIDQGCGIPPEHLPRVFERFYRVDKGRSRDEGGTGLGLAIVKHVAYLHHGRVKVESTPGEGSIFSIHIPRASSG